MTWVIPVQLCDGQCFKVLLSKSSSRKRLRRSEGHAEDGLNQPSVPSAHTVDDADPDKAGSVR